MDGATFPFIAGCIFFSIGALLILSLFQYLWQRARSGGRAVGTIVAIETIDGADDSRALVAAAEAAGTASAAQRYYRPLVRYIVDGREYQVRGSYSMRPMTITTTSVGDAATSEVRIGPLDHDVGQRIGVRYDRANPANALVVDQRRELTVIALQIFCGLMSMILGLLAFYANGNLAWLGPEWHR